MANNEQYESQWRASAHEAVPYTNDYPECFLVLPELIDGAIAQGNATKVTISIELQDSSGILRVIDNGMGAKNIQRLLGWASKKTHNVHHRYGHGSKKCLTKWNKNYKAKWYIRYRNCDLRKTSSSLFTYKGPFEGLDREFEEDPIDDVTLKPSGLEWCIEFDKETLQNRNEPKEIFNAIKEILRTRYSKKYFDKIEFNIIVSINDFCIKENSKENKWITFQEYIEEEVKNGNTTQIKQIDQDFNGITLSFTKYKIVNDTNLRKEFPTYGERSMKCSRVHIALNGRTIEHMPYHKLLDKKNHNSLNGIIGFVNFIGDDSKDFDKMPTPCTTKVSFYENCPKFKQFQDHFIELDKDLLPIIPPIPPPRPPTPPPVPKPKLNYVYLIEKHDSNTDDTIYKFGKTTRDIIDRMREHCRTSKVLLVMEVDDCNSMEKNILKKFIHKKKTSQSIASIISRII